MSGIIGPLTAGRAAFALGTVGVGALIGGAVADRKDASVAQGALIGGASALAGLALLYGGAYTWKYFATARAGVTAGATGASQLATNLSHVVALPAPTATMATTVATTTGSAAKVAVPGWRSWASALFREASSASTIARMPLLPAVTPATSHARFLATVKLFVA